MEEYSSGQANWKVKPATMIEKVAVSQCLRDAFPNDYEGLYFEDEMVAAGTIPAEGYVVSDSGSLPEKALEDSPIDEEQRKSLFRLARKYFSEDTVNDVLKGIIGEFGLSSTKNMTVSVYKQVISRLADTAGHNDAEPPSGSQQ